MTRQSAENPMEARKQSRPATSPWARRFRWLLAASMVAHLFLTPLAGWIGLASQWLEKKAPEPPHEELDAIPIDLIEAPPAPAVDGPSELPDKDPIEVIDKLIPPPPAAAPPEPAATQPKPPPKKPRKPVVDGGTGHRASKPKHKPKKPRPDAGVPPASSAPSGSSAPAGSGAPTPNEPPRTIENPVAVAGKAGDLVKSNARLQMIVYADKLRGHPIGERVADLLPRLPQWSDFFADSVVNPVRDFDRFFVAGPSFYHSDQLVIAMEYNTKRERILKAVDGLVKRGGHWVDGTPVPTALAVADRAERVFVVSEQPVVWVVPPKLQDAALKLRERRIPKSRGAEALVATIAEPKVSLARLQLEIPESVRDVKLRITPLPKGEVLIELSALDKDDETAKKTAQSVSASVNAMVDFLTGLSGVLDRIGFGGLASSMKLPRVELQTHQKEIWGQLTLTREQADFILDRVERELALPPPSAKKKPSPGNSGSK